MKIIIAIEIETGRDPKAVADAIRAGFEGGAITGAIADAMAPGAAPRLLGVVPAGSAITDEEARDLVWWISWTEEEMEQKQYRTAEMERGGEIEKGNTASWRESRMRVEVLAARLDGRIANSVPAHTME